MVQAVVLVVVRALLKQEEQAQVIKVWLVVMVVLLVVNLQVEVAAVLMPQEQLGKHLSAEMAVMA
jgi:hypothetical protein